MKILFLNLLFFFLTAQSSAPIQEIKVGSTAPAIKGISEAGTEVDIGKAFYSGLVLIYFYPKADTPGCTAQACSLRDGYTELTKKNMTIFGVSTDSPETQKKFKEKYKIPFTFISDSDGKVAKAFGVPVLLGFAKRQAFLIDKGVVIWLDRAASTKEQANDILKFLNSRK